MEWCNEGRARSKREENREREISNNIKRRKRQRVKRFIKDDKKGNYTRGERMHSMEKKQTNKKKH